MDIINEQSGFFALFAVFMCLILFYFYYLAGIKIRAFKEVGGPSDNSNPEFLRIISGRLSGIIYTGLIPFIVFSGILKIPLAEIGFNAGQTSGYWPLILLLILLTVLLSFLFTKKRKKRENGPVHSPANRYPRHLIASIGTWIFYLFGYELLFRGILWFLCFRAFGFWPALIINLVLYSAVHIPQGKLMTAGAIPVGIVFCILSQLTGSFFPAFIIHVSMAVSTELFSLYGDPDVHIHLTGRAQ